MSWCVGLIGALPASSLSWASARLFALLVVALGLHGCASTTASLTQPSPPACDSADTLARYSDLLHSMRVQKWASQYADHLQFVVQNKARYVDVEARSGVPRALVATIHLMEASLDFNGNLLNGEPYVSVTTLYPPGRGPWATWEDAAVEGMGDLAQRKLVTNLGSVSIEQMLCLLERHNGIGYLRRGENSPYLWSGTNHYIKGKFLERRMFFFFGPMISYYDPEVVSQQPGAVPFLLMLFESEFVKGAPSPSGASPLAAQ